MPPCCCPACLGVALGKAPQLSCSSHCISLLTPITWIPRSLFSGASQTGMLPHTTTLSLGKGPVKLSGLCHQFSLLLNSTYRDQHREDLTSSPSRCLCPVPCLLSISLGLSLLTCLKVNFRHVVWSHSKMPGTSTKNRDFVLHGLKAQRSRIQL